MVLMPTKIGPVRLHQANAAKRQTRVNIFLTNS